MRYMKLGSLVILLAVIVGTTGCDELSNLTEINDNPNAPSSLTPELILPTAIRNLAWTLVGENDWDLPATSLWVQHFARIQYASTDYFDLGGDYAAGHWNDIWQFNENHASGNPGHGALPQTQEIINGATLLGNANQLAVGMILKAYAVHNVTDMFGDVPYFQALLGASTISPIYDSQKDIYDDLFVQLAAAQGMIGSGAPYGAGDLVYAGDMEKWRRFANSLRLRLAMRLTDVDPTKAATEAAAAVPAGVMRDAGDAALLQYSAAAPDQNPMWVGFVERPGDYRPSGTLADAMLLRNDPRIRFHLDPTVDGRGVMFRGMQNGLADDTPYDEDAGRDFDYISVVGAWHLRPDAPAFFMEYAEVLLLQAEAAMRGWITASPQAMYEDGIREAIRVYSTDLPANSGAFVTASVTGISEAEIDAYLLEPLVAWNGGVDQFELIYMAYWFQLWDQGVEAYTKWRRTDTPQLVAGPHAVANYNTVIPVRFPYPESEQFVNSTNLAAAVAANGGSDAWDQRVWWDVNAHGGM